MPKKDMKVIKDKKRGLVKGYKPNRISLYLLLLNSGRHQELDTVLWDDMEKYKEDEDE
tara:strand:- start:74 stop:247 length:174 start_codon:yes stop_codon:yes gene_type:complete